MAMRYHRIADDLRKLITAGALAAGERLPAESELAARYSVSVPTLRRALDALQAEGLVVKRHGLGNFVRRPLPRIEYSNGRCCPTDPAKETQRVKVSISEVTAEGPVASLMEVPQGFRLIEHVLLTQRAEVPYALARVYVHPGTADLQQVADFSPWGEEIRDGLAATGLDVISVAERAAARQPTDEEAERLRLTTGIPVLAIERKAMDINGLVVEGAVLVLPGDRAEALFTTPAKAKGRR